MHRVISSCAAAVMALAVLPSGAQQNFQTKHYPFDNIHPAVQVDLNGDGIPDFIAQTQNFEYQELISAGSGNYTSNTVSVSNAGGGYPIASGDFNGDGKADVVFLNPLGIAYGNGAGGFSPVKAIWWSAPNNYAQAVVADFNGDGKPDLAIGYDDSSAFHVVLFLNNGNGFAAPKTIYTQTVPSGSTEGFEYTTDLDLVLGDFDADGHADLVLRTTESNPNNSADAVVKLTALYGNESGSFTAKTIATSSTLYEIAAADLNRDGRSDVVANSFSGGTAAYPMRIFYGQANRTFSVVNQSAANDRAIWPMLADFNGDKRKDIIYPELTSAAQDNIGIGELLRTSSGSYAQGGFFPNDTYNAQAGVVPFSQTFVGDYNHDGRPDVGMISSGNQVEHPNSMVIMLNEGVTPDGTCKTPSGEGIAVCSPAGATVSSPVNFAFSANFWYPVRKTEVWIDGVKKSEQYEVFGTEAFHNVSLSLGAGKHAVGLYAVAFDGTMVLHKSYSITVQ